MTRDKRALANAKETESEASKKKIDWLVLLLDALIVVMVFVVLWSGISFFFYWNFSREASTLMQNADMLSYELQNNDYASIIQGRYINEINGKKDAKSYHALAEYTEAASKYKVYVTKGYAEKAGKQRNIMDRSRIEMDKMTIFADKIDKLFGVR